MEGKERNGNEKRMEDFFEKKVRISEEAMDVDSNGSNSNHLQIVSLLRKFLAVQQCRAEAYAKLKKGFTDLGDAAYQQLCNEITVEFNDCSKQVLELESIFHSPNYCRNDLASLLRSVQVQEKQKLHLDQIAHEEKKKANADRNSLTLLTMALPTEVFNRVDILELTKAMWDEVEAQMQKAKVMQNYEGFKPKESESLYESYERFNDILNDLRRNGVHKTNNEITVKFLRNLRPEWDDVSELLQIIKSLNKEDIIYGVLNQLEDRAKERKVEKKIVAESSALISEKKLKSDVKHSRSSSKKIIEPPEILSSDLENSDSDLEIIRLAENLARLSKSCFGKKRRFRKFKYDDKEEKKEEKKEEAEVPKCLNCGILGHFARECKFKKIKNFDYYSKKLQLAKRKEQGQSLTAEEENWLSDSTSSDEDTHYCMMGSVHKSGSFASSSSNSAQSDGNHSGSEKSWSTLRASSEPREVQI